MLRNPLRRKMTNVDKKADMSIQMIIMIVIGLVVMIIVIWMFSNNIFKNNKTLSSCGSIGGKCSDECKAPDSDTDPFSSYIEKPGNYSDCTNGAKCCMKVS